MVLEPFDIRLADTVIRIEPLHESLRSFCRDFLVFGEMPDLSVKVTSQDIQDAAAEAKLASETEGWTRREFTEEYLENMALLALLAQALLEKNILLIHGSCITADGAAYLFTAPSGTGKSTHARLWREMLGDRAIMVNDDKPMMKITPHGVYACGTPWMGKHNLGNNVMVPLRGICVIHQALENRIEQGSLPDCYDLLLQQAYRPKDPEKMLHMLDLLDSMGGQVGIYNLYCRPDSEAAELSYRRMRADP